MVLESTMICVDSSEYMRNGDYFPTRLEAERDAVNLVVQCKLRANAENNVGLLAMTDNNDVLSTLTQDSGAIFMKLHQLVPKGFCNPVNAIRIAHLALKHRQNRNHRTRIVLFFGSPLKCDADELAKTAKKLKKEKVYVDIVSFGGDETVSSTLQAFVDLLNGKDSNATLKSHLVSVPPGCSLQETLLTSAILRPEGEDNQNVAGGDFVFGVDPNEDPELAMALRVSLEEQRQRQEKEGDSNANQALVKASAPVGDNKKEDEATSPKAEKRPHSRASSMGENVSEDEQVMMALQLSLEESRKKMADQENAKKENVEPMDTDQPKVEEQPKQLQSGEINKAKATGSDNKIQIDQKGVENMLSQLVSQRKKASDDKKTDKKDRDGGEKKN